MSDPQLPNFLEGVEGVTSLGTVPGSKCHQTPPHCTTVGRADATGGAVLRTHTGDRVDFAPDELAIVLRLRTVAPDELAGVLELLAQV